MPSVALAQNPLKPGVQQWLKKRINRLARDSRIASARVGVLVVDVPSGRHLVQLRSGEKFNVASNVKLMTSAAALSLLGPEYRFKTALYAPELEGTVVRGNLYLKGFGSPTLSESDLWQMARDLHDSGVRSIRGRLIIDESYFDGQRDPPLYNSKNTDSWYRPPCGALSLSANRVAVFVRPGSAPGKPAQVVLRPRSAHLRLDNRTMTVTGLRRTLVKVETSPNRGRTIVRVSGRVREGFRGKPFRRRIEDPGMMTGYAFLEALARCGIRVRSRRVKRGQVPPRTEALVTHTSTPLALILHAMNKYSNNFVAEQVLKVLGAEVLGTPATWEKGLKAVERFLSKLGIKPGTYTLKNGSGLYDASGFSPEQIVRVLRNVYLNFRTGVDFATSLAIAGTDGTLQHRYLGSGVERYVRAKTGTLAEVVSLSGYAGASKRKGPFAFSILFNGLQEHRVPAARRIADRMAAAMVASLEK
jgi:D-alanyl-D-alanine carboxypeptidase/D-alanyl-D-alanine-endopeptidase (penicillin-binding protein 4)